MWNLVPVLKGRNVFQTKIRSQINDAHTCGKQLFGLTHCHTVRRRKKHHVTPCQRCLVWRGKRQTDVPSQVGKHIRDWHTVFFARRNRVKLYLWVLRQNAQQFDTGITRAAHNTDLDTL